MFKDYIYSIISIMHITSFSPFLLLSTSNVRMSEGTCCRVEIIIEDNCFILIKMCINLRADISLLVSIWHGQMRITNLILLFL